MAVRFMLRELLRERGIVERKFANEVGIREGTFYQICNNKIKYLPVEAVETICATLNVPVDAWMQWAPNE